MGFDMDWFFDQWLLEPGAPEVKVETKVRKAENDAWVLECRTTQKANGFKKLAILVVFDLDGGEKAFRLLVQDQPVQSFHFPLPDRARNVKVDPSGDVLATLR